MTFGGLRTPLRKGMFLCFEIRILFGGTRTDYSLPPALRLFRLPGKDSILISPTDRGLMRSWSTSWRKLSVMILKAIETASTAFSQEV